jgi:hypothetical protein
MSLIFVADDNCPNCSKPIGFAIVERHPTSAVAFRTVECADCDYIKTVALPLRLDDPPELAA